MFVATGTRPCSLASTSSSRVGTSLLARATVLGMTRGALRASQQSPSLSLKAALQIICRTPQEGTGRHKGRRLRRARRRGSEHEGFRVRKSTDV